jgi:hypothetical protein
MRFPNFDQEFESQLASEEESPDVELESVLAGEDEGEEMQLATELLGVSSEEELEGFLSGLITKGAGAASSFLKSPAGQQLGGLLKAAARKALPQVGKAIGGRLAGATGAKAGRQIAAQAGRLFGLELEGLSNEDSEFEVARQFVRFARDASSRLAAGSGTAAEARKAYVDSARTHAPGLVWPGLSVPGHIGGFPASGRWIRRGRVITLM